MGLFSSILGAASDVAGAVTGHPEIAIAGNALAGGLSTSQANSASAASVYQQEQFQQQERLNTYPDTVASLKAAGLNPMLAYTNGGLPVPSGSTYTAQNTQANASAGMSSATAASSQSAQVDNIKSQSDLNRALISKAAADTQASSANAANATMSAAQKAQMIKQNQPQVDADTSWAGRQESHFNNFMTSLNHLNPFVSSASSAKKAFDPTLPSFY
jgi:hypothetical protein